MNEWQRLFFEMQSENAKRIPSCRRYHPDIVRWAIELYSRSPAAYEHLKTTGVLMLPSCQTLRNYRNLSGTACGINQLALHQLQGLEREVEAYITVDEMKGSTV
ncbi:uncharacterized protein LOC104265687 [Ciona intestinalis]